MSGRARILRGGFNDGRKRTVLFLGGGRYYAIVALTMPMTANVATEGHLGEGSPIVFQLGVVIVMVVYPIVRASSSPTAASVALSSPTLLYP